MTEKDYMRRAISLAVKGAGRVSPNPMVGAVIVKNGAIIGEGYHECYGQPHAERNALKNCTKSPAGADMYVTLEPCCHYGKNPPCTEAIIEAKIKRVFVGSFDPNPLVAGKGIKMLRDNGIEVIEDVLREECDAVNEIFFHYITTKTPFVMMKYAMTMDGKIACHTGDAKWISGEEARKNVQTDRNKFKAIMVGSGTVLADDPMLNCRLENGVNPIRIVCDSRLRIPVDSKIVSTANEIPTIIATCCYDIEKCGKLIEKGCQIVRTEKVNGHIELNELMKLLGEMKIDSILLEGGSELNWSALNAGIVHKVQTYISPKIFGGSTSKTPVGGAGADSPAQAFMLEETAFSRFGEDIMIESRVVKKCSQE